MEKGAGVVYEVPVFLSENFLLCSRNHSLTLLASFLQYKGSSFGKDYEQFGRYDFPAKLPSHKENATCLVIKGLGRSDGLGVH